VRGAHKIGYICDFHILDMKKGMRGSSGLI